MKRKHHLKIAILLAAIACLGCSDETKKESQDVEENQVAEDGYASPQHVVEAMKGHMYEFQVPLYPPADRCMVAYMSVGILRAFLMMEEDLDRKKEAEQAFTALIQKYHLTDRLEFTDNEDEEEALAKKAFDGVDLVELYADVESFMAAPYSSVFSGPDGVDDEVEALSLKNLKTDGDDATATVLFSDDTEIPVFFVRSKGRWYLSMHGMRESQLEAGWSMERTLKITFATDADLEGATAKGLLKGVVYDRTMEATLSKKTKGRVAYLEFSTQASSDPDPVSISEQVGKLPGVESVDDWSLGGVEFHEALQDPEEGEEDLEVEESAATQPTPEMEQPSPEPDAGAPDNAVEEASAEMTAERVWTDSTGKHKRKRKFVSLKDGVVTLKDAAGKESEIPLDKLSNADQEFVRGMATGDQPDPGVPMPDPEENTATVEESMAVIKRLGGKVWVGAARRADNILRGGPDLLRVSFVSSGISDAGLADLKELTNIWGLDLRGTEITDAGLVHLEGLTNLETLSLAGTTVGDAGLAHLKGLTKLGMLGLQDTKVTDAGLEHLQGLTGLDDLNFAGTDVGDAGLAHLKGLTKLVLLHLEKTKVTDAGLVHLRDLAVLKQLFLDFTEVTDAGLRHMRRLPKLISLSLIDASVADAGLVHLQGVPSLKWLNLSGTKISDAGLAHLKGMTLEMLHLKNTEVTDAGLEHLQGLTGMKWMNIGRTKISDAGLVHLKEMTHLELLDLYSTQVTDAGLKQLQGLTTLETLGLTDTKVTDAGLEHLRGLTSLVKLELLYTEVTDAGLEKLKAALPKCKIEH